MSGEKSKSSGEHGEKLGLSFLEMIVWSSSLKSVSIKCNNGKHRTPNDNQKGSHGDDRGYIYNNPFYDNRTDVVHISIKNNLDGYSERDSELKSQFKGHLEEANEIIACAQYDATLLDQLSSFNGRRHKEHSGLLIWTSTDLKSADRNILSVIKNVRLDETCTKNVYFFDGARIDFFKKIIDHSNTASKGNYEFLYPETGNLVNRLDERHGKVLPLEMIIADVIPMKVVIDGQETLFVYVNQAFERDAYRRVLSLALGIAGAWPREVRIGFPDFNVAHHGNEARSSELPFVAREKKFIPFCFIPSNLDSLTND
ncbi:hypothetical protein [Massilia violaceinigra]|uniref:hypothetical protein n=1 Tax=Massilia violaceinigra TaxID=2045208 RepID=UPI0012FDE069|nr:hypothetical protein [Massilia violaceinigra]